MSSSRKAMAVLGAVLGALATGTAAVASSSPPPPPTTPANAPTSPVEQMSEAQADAIPTGKVTYGSAGSAFDPNGGPGPAPSDVIEPAVAAKQATVTRHTHAPKAHVSVAACTLEASDPFLIAPAGRKAVEASGFQACFLGVGQKTQACLYKQHHALGIPYFKKTHCGPNKYDRRPTYRPVSAIKPCDPSGTGRWRTVIFGSIYYNGPVGPGRYSGSVRSQNDKSFSRCN